MNNAAQSMPEFDLFQKLEELPEGEIPHLTVYTDGACSGNPGPGGWGAVLIYDGHEADLCGGATETTNNRMEMSAAIEAIKALPRQSTVDLYTDSMYLRDGVTQWMQNWKRRGWKTASNKPVKNQDLWQELDVLIKNHKIEWHWVKGHAGNKYNERADTLACNAIIAVEVSGKA